VTVLPTKTEGTCIVFVVEGGKKKRRVCLYYEPVWAIGTGLVCGAEDANEVHLFLRGVLENLYDEEVAQQTRIQYGGSVTPDSVDELMAQPEIDGCLVGGASLDSEKFGRIINYVKKEAAVAAE